MAAITAPTIDDTVQSVNLGNKLRRFYVTTNAATTSTWVSGIDGIVELAWLGDAATDFCVPTASAGTITFTTDTGSAHTGYLYVWSAS